MFCDYLPRTVVHPDRHGTARRVPPKWIVLHTSEQQLEGAGAAAQLARFMTTPGDRPSSSGGRYGSSYHDVIDLDMVIRPAVPHDVVAFAAPGANTEGLHVCLPARAGQTAGDWLDDFSRNQIRTLAGYIVDQADAYNIPLVFPLTAADLQAGRGGITDHYRIGRAFGRTDHTDVGSAFPWDLLATEVHNLTTPPPTSKEEDPMLYIIQPAPPVTDDTSLVVSESGNIRRALNTDYAYAASHDIPILPLTSIDQHTYAVNRYVK